MKRLEDDRLLRGSGSFVDDIQVPQALHVAFLRSPLPHASVASLDTSATKQLDGVRAVCTGRDLDIAPLQAPITTPNTHNPPRPILAGEAVRFAGEAIAAVVADSRYIAEDAVDLIRVDLDPLPAVDDPLTSMR